MTALAGLELWCASEEGMQEMPIRSSYIKGGENMKWALCSDLQDALQGSSRRARDAHTMGRMHPLALTGTIDGYTVT